MNRRIASAILSALLYAQGLLGFAGLATVLLRDRAHAEVMMPAAVPVATPYGC